MARICVVTHFFPPHIGGIERVAYEQSRRLSKMGYQMSVLTSQLGREIESKIDGIRVFYYPAYHFAEKIGLPVPIPKLNSLNIYERVIKESDLVHAHGHPYLSSYIACKLAMKWKKPFILTQHNTFIDFESWLNFLERANDLILGRKVLKASNKVITVSRRTMEYVLKLGANKFETLLLYNGVDTDRFYPMNKQESRGRLDLPNNCFVVLTVRRLVYKNALDTLIDAASSIVPNNPDILFVIVGTGPDAGFIKEYTKRLGIEANVIFTGGIPDEYLPHYYSSADVFVLPSRSGEGFPLTVLESMAAGLPVIATDTGGIPEVVRNTVNGFLIPPKRPNALADAILSLFSSRGKTRKMGNEARRIVKEKFTWKKTVQQLKGVYDEILCNA